MNKILMCIPIYYQTTKVEAALKSLLRLNVKENSQLDIVLGVNGSSSKLNKFLAEFVVEASKVDNVGLVCAEFFEGNLGKGKAINKLYELYGKGQGYDFIISSDSDILYTDPLTINKFSEAYVIAKRGSSDVGSLSAQQEGACCHLQEGYETIRHGAFSFRRYKSNHGVAGGVLFIPTAIWELVGGYAAFNKYGSDDGHFGQACMQKGLNVLVCEETIVFHPPEENIAYAEWKKKSVLNKLNPDEEKGFTFVNE